MEVDAAALAGGAHFGDCFCRPVDRRRRTTRSGTRRRSTGAAPEAPTTCRAEAPALASRRSSTARLFPSAARRRRHRDERPVRDAAPDARRQAVGSRRPVHPRGLSAPSYAARTVAINARARVELKKATIVQGSLPLAVPDVDPRHVTVTFIDEATGSAIAPALSLTKGSSAGGLNYWTAAAPVPVPAGDEDRREDRHRRAGGHVQRMRREPAAPGSSATTTRAPASGWRRPGVGSGGTVDAPKPRSRVGDDVLHRIAVLLGVFVSRPPRLAPPRSRLCCRRSRRPSDRPRRRRSTRRSPAPGRSRDVDSAAATGRPVTSSTSPPQAARSTSRSLAVDDGAASSRIRRSSASTAAATIVRPGEGPRALDGATTVGAPYTLSAGTHTITVRVGLEGSLDLTNAAQTDHAPAHRRQPDERDRLRRARGLRSSGARSSTAARRRTSSTRPGSAPIRRRRRARDCVPTKTGRRPARRCRASTDASPRALRTTGPSYDAADDPRVVQAADHGLLRAGRERPDRRARHELRGLLHHRLDRLEVRQQRAAPGDVKKGAIWGHFIKYVAPDPNSTGDETCDPTSSRPASQSSSSSRSEVATHGIRTEDSSLPGGGRCTSRPSRRSSPASSSSPT